MSTLTREEAGAIIKKIFRRYGGIRPELRPKTDKEVLDSLESIRNEYAKVTEILATNIYSSDTRFVLELIQNAADNKYDLAKLRGKEPEIKFHIRKDTIVVDCNEDGFTRKNVKALCSTGGSTKKGSSGYIGEKGIGFKSVFKVAKKVHIQSEPFSFTLKHQENEDGLGMITPLEEPHQDLPEQPMTRTVLYLNETSDLEQIKKDFKWLPGTLLLFLERLKSFTIKIDTIHGTNEIVHRYKFDDKRALATLTRISTSKEGITRHDSLYRIERKQLAKLPMDRSRPGRDHADVVLGFPIDEHGQPIIKQQFTFAFLPLRKLGFKFIIQSDFITQANREDVSDCSWNEEILNGVAATFVAAVKRFNTSRELQYGWVKYIPDESIADSFWSRLTPKIQNAVKKAPVFRSWNSESPKKLSALRRVGPNFQDTEGQPLLKDLPNELYLSNKYYLETTEENTKLASENMKRLGIMDLRWPEIKERLNADISSSESRLKAYSTSEDWHTKMAVMLLDMAKEDERVLYDLSNMPVVPLCDGRWSSSAAKKLYFPVTTIDGVDVTIPVDLGLDLVKLDASRNSARNILFQRIGVGYCSSVEVINRIINSRKGGPSHIQYLYYFLSEPEKVINNLPDPIPLVDNKGRKFFAATGYLESSENYSAEWLFGSDHDAHFLHSSYLGTKWNDIRHNGRTLRDWLNQVFGLVDYPRLVTPSVDPSNEDVSPDFQFIMNSRPTKLLGTLKSHWQHYNLHVRGLVKRKLSEATVPCANKKSTQINTAYLPLQNILQRAFEFGVQDEMSFLKLPFATSHQTLATQWELLSYLDVKRDLDLNFYLEVLIRVSENLNRRGTISATNLATLYKEIVKCCDLESRLQVRTFFESKNLIRIRQDYWVKSNECLWSAPYVSRTMAVLDSIEEYRGPLTEELFTTILGCTDLTWQQSVHELIHLQKEYPNGTGGLGPEIISKIYHHIDGEIKRISGSGMTSSYEQAILDLRDNFESNKLIYVHSTKKWHALSSSLWASSTHIAYKAAVCGLYEGLDGFFQNFLGIQPPTVSMLVDDLRTLYDQSTFLDISRITKRARALIYELNDLKPDANWTDSLKDVKFLPVKLPSGFEDLYAPSDLHKFIVINRKQHMKAYEGKITKLSFQIEDIKRLHLLLCTLGLESRYTTSLVTEKTTVTRSAVDTILTNDMRKKSYAILRCAVHFRSPKVHQNIELLHRTLKNALVSKSVTITKSMNLKPYPSALPIHGGSQPYNLHIEQDNEKIHFYVPQDEIKREQCYMQQMPQKLMELLELGSVVEPFFLRILTARSAPALEMSLTEDDIEDVRDISAEEREPPLYYRPEVESQRQPEQPILSSVADSMDIDPQQYVSPPENPNKRRRSDLVADYELHDDQSNNGRQERRATSGSSSPSYGLFLDKLIYLAQTATISIRERSDTTSWVQSIVEPGAECFKDENSFPYKSACGDKIYDRASHDKKLGAAGELYVFKFLSKLVGDDRFTIDNWPSTIREVICSYRPQEGWKPWRGFSETTDFVYTDTAGILTGELLKSGIVRGPRWTDARPAYYIEVKTTLKGPDEYFYVSESQYNRMKKHKISQHSSDSIAEVYIIFRVFNAGRKNTGMHILVDPLSLEEEGKLEFTAQQYRVKPIGV